MLKINDVLVKLQNLDMSVIYKAGNEFKWSYNEQTITYINNNEDTSIWALIHESAHAQLRHNNYKTDQQLLTLEMQAWQKAKLIAQNIGVKISQDHIEDCLDTYRDWLHKRSTCPTCHITSTQNNVGTYKCFNCHCSWKVPVSPQCKIIKTKVSV